MKANRLIKLRNRIETNRTTVDILNKDLVQAKLSPIGMAVIEKEINSLENDIRLCIQELTNNGYRTR